MGGKTRLSTSIVNDRLLLLDTGIQLVEEYLTVDSKSLFSCRMGHTWTARVAHVLNGVGCPHCSGKFPKSKKIVNKILSLNNRDITMIGDYRGANYVTKFECSVFHQWETRPAHILNGSGCPSCANFGFNPTKAAHGYVLLFDTFIKYGITTDLKIRLKKHKTNNGSYILHKTKLFETGHDAIKWENHIKTFIGGKYVGRDICPDGWTETLPLEKLHEIEALL